MKGDFSRSTFNPAKHYSGVRMQQGRVQLDADWNENLDILRHRIETETIDVIGQCGVPIHDAGFGVVTDFNSLTPDDQTWIKGLGFQTLGKGDFYLTGGRAYVDGILVEDDHTLPFSQQPFVLPKGSSVIGADGLYLLYLDVWERHITALEDPSIREVALGGPDTASRSQVIWQAVAAKAGKLGDTVTCDNVADLWPAPSTGTLTAQTVPQDDPSDPCAVPIGAGYKRLENQLYRVEIHHGSDSGSPTYKWSRDNGSVVVAVKEFPYKSDATKLRTSSLGRDDVLGLHENDWVEVLDDATELAGLPGVLVQIVKIEPDNLLTLSAALPNSFAVLDSDGNPTHLKVRRWDSDGTGGDGLALSGSFADLEGGIQVKFDTTGSYRTGDYWLIPARTVPGQYGDIEWPQDESKNPLALLPFGILHHYCKLAILSVQSSKVTLVEDCRKEFPPLTELPTGGDRCCSVTVGQGGNFSDLQSALDARPVDATWWTICILPGTLSLPDTLQVDGAQSLTFSGCGPQSRLVGPPGKPLFAFTDGQDITLEGLRIEASSPSGAVLFSATDGITLTGNLALNAGSVVTGMKGNVLQPVGPLVVIDSGSRVEIRDNDLLGLPAVQANGQDLHILHNRISGGGIQIIPPSRLVEIDDNFIFKGIGPGIQLGGGDKSGSDFVAMYYAKEAPVDQAAPTQGTSFAPQAKNLTAATRQVTISRNLIGSMTGSGIVTETNLAAAVKLGDVEFLDVRANQIVGCCQTADVMLGKASVGGGLAAIGLFSTRITDNFIAENGMRQQAACGIFVLDGSDIEIAGNVVVENGSPANPEATGFYQAGIAAQYVFGNFLGLNAGQGTIGTRLGYPALRILGNRVVCPAGQALTVTAMGGVVVDGNSFTTRERQPQPTDPLNFGEKGACVFVFDLGLPIWLPEFALLLQLLSSGQTNLHIEDFQKIDELFSLVPDGRVLFHDNQVNFNTDVEETVQSLGQLGPQWFQAAWNAATFSALLLSLDDLSLSGNQFQATVPLYALEGLQKDQAGKLLLADLLAYFLKFMQVGTLGTVIRATGNGLSERIFSNLVSYVSIASAMNVATSNETTHLVVTNAPKKEVANNLSLTS
jgi:hypothetical protein